MSDTTPKDQPPQPLQFPEPVEVQARTTKKLSTDDIPHPGRAGKKRHRKPRKNVIPFSAPPSEVKDEYVDLIELVVLTEMLQERVTKIRQEICKYALRPPPTKSTPDPMKPKGA